MAKAKQISVFMENRPGAVGDVLRAFSGQGVNLRAVTISDTVDHAVVRMIVSDAAKAIHILEGANMLCLVHDVLEAHVEDAPGALERLAQRLAEERINIHYMYGSGASGGAQAVLFLRVSDLDRAETVLSKR